MTDQQKDELIASLQKSLLEEKAARKKAEAKSAASAAPGKPAAKADATKKTGTGPVPSPDAENTLKAMVKESGVSSKSPISALDEYYAVPTSPAASALGMSPETLPTASVPKTFNAFDINGVDVRGNAQTGLAIDIAVARLFTQRGAEGEAGNPGSGLTVGQWAEGEKGSFSDNVQDQWGYWRRVISRTHLSLAGTRGTSEDDKSIRLAAGLNVPLLVSREPGMIVAAPEQPFNDSDFMGRMGNTLHKHGDWTIGGFGLATGRNQGGASFEYGGSAWFSTFSFSFDQAAHWHAVTNVTYRESELVPIKSVTKEAAPGKGSRLIQQDSLLLSGGLQYKAEEFNVTLFGAYLMLDEDIGGSSDAFRYGAEAEFRIPTDAKNLWLTLSVGQELGGSDHRPDQSFVLGGVKVGFGSNEVRK